MIVAILGAGPAGMSCANACLSFGLTPVVIERGPHLGGAQRDNFHPNAAPRPAVYPSASIGGATASGSQALIIEGAVNRVAFFLK